MKRQGFLKVDRRRYLLAGLLFLVLRVPVMFAQDLKTQGEIAFLKGDYRTAAASFEKVALRTINSPSDAPFTDYRLLLRAASCWAAAGEWGHAFSLTRMVLDGETGNAPLQRQAQLLYAQLSALYNHDTRSLVLLSQQTEYAAERPTIYYTLWKVTGDETWKSKLLAEFPDSTLALAASGKGAVRAGDTPFWLLGGVTPQAAAPQTANSPPPAADNAPPPTSGNLQTGYFSGEANARAQAARLRAAGFDATVSPDNTANGKGWRVLVPTGADMERTLLALKNAGFESFPAD
jgi:hypothetical protein